MKARRRRPLSYLRTTLPAMRVVAGSARGRKIVAPPGLDVRPTLDRVRQAIFNALDARGAVEDARVIDVFAGSGALGIEALSRGARHVTFVEHDRKSLTCIKDNLEHLGFTEQATIVRSDVVAWSGWRIPEADLILIDPPYTFAGWTQLLERVLPALSRPEGTDPELRGIAVLETARPLALPPTWEVVREQRYGGTVVTFAVPAVSAPGPTTPADGVGASEVPLET
jgi:16S rRNA (guanine966-N2)-methyltransferase